MSNRKTMPTAGRRATASLLATALFAVLLSFTAYPREASALTAPSIDAAVRQDQDSIDLMASVDDVTGMTGLLNYDYARQIVDFVNQERAAQGLSPLSMDEDLTEAAMVRSAECALNFSHTRPDGSSCFTISGKASGENIAAGSSTPAATMSQWMNSPGHRSNIMGSWNSIGVGCFTVGGVTYWTQLFGRGAATGTVQSGSVYGQATIGFSYATVPLSQSGFNLNQAQEDTVSLSAGDTYELRVGIPNPGWDYVFCPADPDFYTWKSSNENVATVSEHGVVTAVSNGTATVTATSQGGHTWTRAFVVSGGSAANPGGGSVDLPEAIPGQTQIMWRLYNPNTGEHFYTSNSDERANLISLGWKNEGAGWVAPVTGDPVYRLYNSHVVGGDHHYTMDKDEYDWLVNLGWTGEGIGWYSAGSDGMPLYRQYNPNAVTGTHNYTANAGERDMLVSLGWKDEGIGWYGCK